MRLLFRRRIAQAIQDMVQGSGRQQITAARWWKGPDAYAACKAAGENYKRIDAQLTAAILADHPAHRVYLAKELLARLMGGEA
jgi:hypothetical protein